jgi:GT2 family glycosyltransferase
MSKNKVVIITLNYNQNYYTLKCIVSILESIYDNYKILLIDNGSEQETFDDLKNKLPKNEKLTLHRIEKNRGYVGGINYGLEEGEKLQTDYFLIMNNDTILDKNAITELVKTAKAYSNKVIVSGKVYHFDEANKFQDLGREFSDKRMLKYKRIGFNEIDNGQYETVEERDMLDDVFWLFSPDLYKKIGGYSPYFWFNAEQADFALRAKKAGYKLIYTPKAKLWHKGSVSIGGSDKNPKQAYWTIQSSLILRCLHLKRKYFILFYFSTVQSVLGTILKSIFFYRKKKYFLYTYGKLAGFIYFNRWVFTKQKNTGEIPNLIEK